MREGGLRTSFEDIQREIVKERMSARRCGKTTQAEAEAAITRNKAKPRTQLLSEKFWNKGTKWGKRLLGDEVEMKPTNEEDQNNTMKWGSTDNETEVWRTLAHEMKKGIFEELQGEEDEGTKFCSRGETVVARLSFY